MQPTESGTPKKTLREKIADNRIFVGDPGHDETEPVQIFRLEQDLIGSRVPDFSGSLIVLSEHLSVLDLLHLEKHIRRVNVRIKNFHHCFAQRIFFLAVNHPVSSPFRCR